MCVSGGSLPDLPAFRHGERMTTKMQHSVLKLELAAADRDGWIMLFPAGTSKGRDGRGPYHLKDMAAVVAASTADAIDLAIDRDHQFDILPAGAQKLAAGWIKEMQARADGIYGRPEWTPSAKQQLDDREYRYVSPVFLHTPSGEVKKILRVSLVNDPNLEMKAVAAADRLAQTQETETMDELMKKLAELLGLGGDATEASILEAVQALKGIDTAVKEVVEAPAEATAEEVVEKLEEHIDEKVEEKVETELAARVQKALAAKGKDVDPSTHVPIGVFNELKKDMAAMKEHQLGESVEKAVAAATAAGKILPSDEQQNWAKAYAAKDMKGFEAYVASAPVIVKPGSVAAGKKPAAQQHSLTDNQKSMCAKMGIKEADFLKTLSAEQQQQ